MSGKGVDPVLLQTRRSIKHTRELFIENKAFPEAFEDARKLKLSAKIAKEYQHVKDMEPPRKPKRKPKRASRGPAKKRKREAAANQDAPVVEDDPSFKKIVASIPKKTKK
jgi:hypothetical protein